jgi:hypothetical protein
MLLWLFLQQEDKSLPPWLVKQICELKNLKELDLSDCTQLEVLPAAFAAHGVGRRLKVLELPPQLSSTLPDAAHAAAAPGKEWSPQKKLAAILLRQQRRQAILKLATQPEPMLTTLERMSWLLIILATITLTAFLQPGMKGIVAGNAAELDSSTSAECLDKAGKDFLQEVRQLVGVDRILQEMDGMMELSPQSQAQGVCRRCTSTGDCINWTFPHTFDPPTRGSCLLNSTLRLSLKNACWKQLVPDTERCVEKQVRLQRMASFALPTIASFCLTLLCLMLIVVVSLPRLKCTDLAYEAGRLWLFLLMIWLLFVESVQLAFTAFWMFAVVVYEPNLFFSRGVDYFSVFESAGAPGGSWAILGTAALTVPALIVVCVYFASLYPGHRAVHLACCSCTCLGSTQDFVHRYTDRDLEEGPYGMYVSSSPELLSIKSE